MQSHLILYSSHDGQTRKIAEAISRYMRGAGFSVDLHNLEECKKLPLEHYASVLIGAPIRYGSHLKSARDFIANHAELLNAMPSGFFSVNLTARKPEKRNPQTNRYMQKFLRQSPWQPHYRGVLAGALLYTKYRWYDRMMIRLIMKITGGSTDTSKDIEYTDWDCVKSFADGYTDYLNKALVQH